MKEIILQTEREETLKSASDTIIQGGVIAYPTETLYGLGARYDNAKALLRIYELKKRPEEKAMPLIIGSIDQLDLLAVNISDNARRLMSRFWPGPLTLLIEAKKGLGPFITYDGKIAVRMPGESFALRLAQTTAIPITSTSANISGMPSALNADMVAQYFGEYLDIIVDGGECGTDRPSTIIDVTGANPMLIRKGAVPFSALKST